MGRRSRLSRKPGTNAKKQFDSHPPANSETGILNYFDLKGKNNKDKTVISLVDDEQVVADVEEVRNKENHVENVGQDVETVDVRHDGCDEEKGDEERDGVSTQDILLGDAGRVVWNGSPYDRRASGGQGGRLEMPGGGVPNLVSVPSSSKKKFLSSQPVMQQGMSGEGGRDGLQDFYTIADVEHVVGGVSMAVQGPRKRQKGQGDVSMGISPLKDAGESPLLDGKSGQKSKPRDKKSAAAALMKCCNALQSKIMAMKTHGPSEKKSEQRKGVMVTSALEASHVEKSVASNATRTDTTNTIVKEEVIPAGTSWGDDSDSDEDILSHDLDAIEAAALAARPGVVKKEEGVDQHDTTPTADVVKREEVSKSQEKATIGRQLISTVRCTVASYACDSSGYLLSLRKTNEHNKMVHVRLLSPWDGGDYRAGDPVNLINAEQYEIGSEAHCTVGIGHPGFLIHFPDILLGGTRVTQSSACHRKGYLSERITGEGTTAAAVKGVMYHQLVQHALLHGYRRSGQIKSIIEEIVSSMPEQLLDSELSAEEASSWLHETIPSTLSFLNRFVRQEPTTNNKCNLNSGFGNQSAIACIQDIADVEEYIISPSYGLKGFIDSTFLLKAKFTNPAIGANTSTVESFAPLEIKSGLPRDTDAAQVLLYLLALEERYGSHIPYGMLLYKSETSSPTLVKRDDNLLSCILANRNDVAAALARSELPPLSQTKNMCTYCYERSTCALTHAARSKGTAEEFLEGLPETSSAYKNLKTAYDMETGHLSESDKIFLAKWDRLLDIEGESTAGNRHEIWSMSGRERERLGRCIADVSLVEVADAEWVSKGHNGFNIKGRLYTFMKRNGGKILANTMPYGEPLMISIENGPVGVSRGHLHAVEDDKVIVHTDKPIRKKVVDLSGDSKNSGKSIVELDLTWRLDREEVATTVPRMRSFLFGLFSNVQNPGLNERRKRLRELIVDLRAPHGQSELSSFQASVLAEQVSNLNLNKEQEQAVKISLTQQEYSLILGVPGAGKTTAVIAMVRALEKIGKRVLLVSYTNSAVDHVMLKLAAQGFSNFVRIGRQGRVHKSLLNFLPTGPHYNAKTAEDFDALMKSTPVVGVSALGITDPLLRRCDFDVCIVDEAGQITLPAILGPLTKANRFVLVGDHHQLPPLVSNPVAEEGGLGVPLFARLAEAHPGAVVTLSKQYRMSKDIQSISNTFVYNGALQCGTKEVAESQLQLSMQSIPNNQPAWMYRALEPKNSVAFLDTKAAACRELSRGEAVENHGEANIAMTLIEMACSAGVPEESMAVISPYRSQVSLLIDKVRNKNLGVECLTIDKAQGKDKDMVIVSLVRSNDSRAPGKLLDDARRVNVAITRAKSKLILIGDSCTLKNLTLFDTILGYFSQQGWIHGIDTQIHHINKEHI